MATVRTERSGSIAVVRLDRPAKRNALDTATTLEFNAALRALAADDDVAVLVVSTTSPAALCAGADLDEDVSADGGLGRMRAYTELYALIESFPVPTVAVAVGHCVGAGAEIVAGVDLRVVGDNLRLAWAGARLGVPVGPARLSQLVGVAAAKDLVFTGRVVDADEAHRLGLAQRRATPEQAETEALALAATIAAQNRGGVRELKALFRELDAGPERVRIENERLLRFQQHGAGIPRR